MLAQAVRASGAALTVVTIVPCDTEEPSALAPSIESELKHVWGIEATIRVARRSPPSRLPWLAQQLRGVLGYGHTPTMLEMTSAELVAVLRSELGERPPRFVVAHRLASMFVLTQLAVNLPPTYFDMDDVEHIFALRSVRTAASVRRKIFGLMALPGLLYAEWRALRRARLSFVCSTRDVHYLSSQFLTRTVQMLPNAVAIPLAAHTPPPAQTILMVGAYTYGPNADAAEFFINDILPLLRKRFPEAQLWLAGAGTEGLPSFGRSPANVRFLGFVDDLATLYESARIVVCPVRYGGGTRVKLVEAAAWGKAIVTTTLGAEGLGMKPGQDALFADFPGAFADACARLIEDEALCARLGGNARRLAIEQFDQERIVARLASTFEHDAATA
jgi:hypothetical protein